MKFLGLEEFASWEQKFVNFPSSPDYFQYKRALRFFLLNVFFSLWKAEFEEKHDIYNTWNLLGEIQE